jgi:hypothetical protein
VYYLAKQGHGGVGLSDEHAREMVAAAYMESRWESSVSNGATGAEGLFQLLPAYYGKAASACGGLLNPWCNTATILWENYPLTELGSYMKYWATYTNATPGAAAAYVENSGSNASFYAWPLSWLPSMFDQPPPR